MITKVRQFFRIGLTGRLLWLTLIAVCPALAIQAYNEYDLRQSRETEIRAQVLQITHQFGAEMGELREGARQLLVALANLPRIQRHDVEKCSEILVSMKSNYPNYLALGAVDMDGHEICSSESNPRASVAGMPFFKKAVASDNLAVGYYWIDPVTGGKAIHFAVRYKGPDGQPAGVVYAALDLKWLSSHLADRGLPPGASILIADRIGNIIARLPNPDALVGKNMRRSHEDIMDGDKTGWEEAVGVDGVARIFGYVPPALPPGDLFLSAGLSKDAAFVDIVRATRRGVALIILGLAVAMVAAIHGGWHFIRKPIQELTRVTGRWRDGDLSARARAWDPNSEIGRLALGFNEMAEAVETRGAAQKRAEHELTEFAATLEDRVERRTAELEQANRVKSQFLANMSHEIRTPMNGVLGMLQLLLDSGLTEIQKRYATTALRSGESLLGIVNGVLDLSKIESGKLQLYLEPFDLQTVVEESVDLFSGAARTKNLNLAFLIAPGVPRGVIGDAGRLRQVLTNLLGNAVKFTARGEVELQVNVTASDPESAVLEFIVRDTGIGIPASRQAEIFDVFAQADGSTTREYGGTGLGLSIARQLCELMGGSISVTSEPGRGSEFRFAVKMRKALAGEVQTAAREYPALKGLSALVIDDNATNLRIAESHLSRLGIQARLITGPNAAFDMLLAAAENDRPYDFVLIDRLLPGLDGRDLAKRIREEPALAGSRLIMIASTDDVTEHDCPFLDRWLTKPLRHSELVECLLSLCARDEPAQGDASATPGQGERPFLGARILLAEDNIVNLEVATAILRREGCQVTTATNGRIAVAMMENEVFDIVLMDCQMPEMDGFQATAEIRRQEAGSSSHTPIIALTANAIEGDRERCLRAGMDDYLPKPVSREAMRAALARWFRQPSGASDPSASRKGRPPADPTKLSEQALTALRDLGDDAALRPIMARFLRDSADLVAQLRRGAETKDAALLGGASHTLKSTSMLVGAEVLAASCEILETLIREGRTADAAVQFQPVAEHYQAIRPAIEALARGGLGVLEAVV